MRFNSLRSGSVPFVVARVLVALFSVTFGVQVSIADCFPIPAGLIGWWPGDGNANNFLGTNNGTLQGGAVANIVGKVGNAFRFDGTNGFVQVPNSTVLQPTNLTIEGWVRFAGLDSPGTATAGIQYIVFKQNTRTANFEGFDLGKSRVGSNDVFRFIVTSASGQSISIQSTTTISTGVWYHVAAVRGGNFAQLYVNGVLERQTNVTFAQNYGNFPLYFGTSGQSYWDRKLKGDLDEVALYNRALAAGEIAAIYSAGAAGKCKTTGPQASFLVNVDFEGGTQSSMIGPAAIGQSLSDFWNAYEGAGAWHYDGTLAFLKAANGSNTQIGLSVPNTPGSWGNGSSNSMYAGYIYPNPPEQIVITVTNLPAGRYDFYLYSSDGNFRLTAAGADYGVKSSLDNPVNNPPIWQEGRQYVVYRDVLVTEFAPPVVVIVQPGVFGYSTVSGMQIAGNLQTWFTLQPTNSTLLEGDNLVLSANAFGFSSGEHRWYFNGVPLIGNARISGVASNTLSILNVTTNDTGNYWCVVSNAASAGTSAVAVVTVNPIVCASQAGLVAWWTGDGQAFDSANTNHALMSNGVAFASGKVGGAFSFDGADDLVRVMPSGSLDVGASNGLTIECWVKPSDISAQRALVEWNEPSKSYGLHWWISVNGGAGSLYANLVDTAGSFHGIWTGPDAVATNAFVHVALTYDKTTGVATLYRNGTAVTSQNLGVFTPQTTYPLYLGHRPSDGGNYYKGLMDEVGIYNRALSTAEIRSIYEANMLGKCHQPIALIQQPQNQSRFELQGVRFTSTATGALPLAYRWYFNGTLLSDNARVGGSTNYLLTIANLQTNDAGNYWVVASNASGMVTSQVATLTVNPPVCSPAASGLVGWWPGNGNALDAVGTNNGTLVSNVTYSAGHVGQAFVLDGDRDGVVVGNPPSLQLQNFTIEAWIKRTDPTLVTYSSYTTASLFGYGNGGYCLGIYHDGRLFMGRVDIDNVTLASPVITDTNWHHVAVTKTGTSVAFYIDGVAYSVPPYSSTYTFGTSAAIGQRADTRDVSFLGSIDEVAVYNRALSAAEIDAIYGAGSLGHCPLPLEFVQQPQSQTKVEQQAVTFAAFASGMPPLTYQWYFNGAALANDLRITGTTNSSLSITNLSTSDSGSYWLVVSNFTGMATSSVATLTVNPPMCSPPVNGLVAWWTGDEQPFDSANTNHGALSNGLAFATGKVGSAFSFDGANDLFRVPASDSLNVGTSNGLTIECWVKPSDISAARALVEWDDPSKPIPYGVHLWITYSGGPGCLFANLVDTSGNNRMFASSAGVVATDAFVHVALTYDKTTGVATLYRNGSVAASQNLGVFTPQTTYPLYLGHRPADGGNYFKGLLDEVGIYNRVLSVAEIQSIYDAGALGKCHQPIAFIQQPQNQSKSEQSLVRFTATATGAPPLSYHWYFNGLPIADNSRVNGTTNYSLTISGLQTNDAGSYWVVASNVSGSATSVVASLTITPPVCTPPAAGLVDWWTGDNHPYDNTGTIHQTLVNGAAFATGRVGMAFSFDGVDDRATNSIPKLTSVANSTYTIEFWARPSAARATTAESTSGTAGVSNQRYAIFPDPGDTTIAGSGVSVGTNGVSVFEHGNTYLPSLLVYDTPVTNWTHVAVVYQARQPRLYLNGVLVRVGLTSGRTSYPSTLLGERGLNYGYYAGLLDEVSIYNRALTDSEIADIYSSQSLGKCPPPPKFVQPLAGGPFPLGSQFVLSAAVAGSLPINYQWYYANAVLTNGGRIQGATSNKLVISSAQFTDSGDYFVIVDSPYGGATSTVATVQVINAPFIAQQPTDQIGVVGGVVQFTAQAGGQEPFTYGWYQNSTALSDDARHLGTATPNLIITNLVSGDAGNYTLRVTNVHGSVTSAVATLTVFTPPSITTHPRGYSVPIGLPVTLSGAASGTAPLQYSWLLNGVPVSNATAASLTISNLSANQFGNYQLVATNFGGAATSAVAQLTRGNVGIWGSYSQAGNVPLWPTAGLSNVISIVAGSAYSLALRQDGTVYAWGFSTPATNIPPTLSGVAAVAAGHSHALALLSNGVVRAWGLGTSGQTNVPATLSNVVAVAAGSVHSAALRSDGTVVVWGGTSVDGQTNIPPGLMKVVAIDGGGVQTLALREDGTLVVWGGRTQFPAPADRPPYPVPYDIKNVAGFSAGPALNPLNLALLSNGLVRAWGATGLATNVPPNLSGIISVEGAGGSDQSTGSALAIRSNRTVVSWGPSGASSLTNVPTGLSNVIALAGGLSHALALVDDGRPLIVRPPVGGTFYSGRDLLLKAKVTGNTPLSFQWFKDGNPIAGGTDESLLLPFAQVADAGNYYLVVSSALGVAQSVTVPVTIVDRAPVLMSQPRSRFAYYGSPFSVGASLIGSGPLELLWLQDNAPAYSGTNDLVFDRVMPQHGGNYQLIASNPFGSVTSSIAQIRFSRVAAWGGMPAFTNIPVEVDLGTVRGIAAGGFHALVIRSNGTVAAWGTTSFGTTNVPAGLTGVTAVAAGTDFSVALKQDGTVVAWGLNSSGQTNVPSGLTDVTAISVGASHALALRANGTVVAWGLNSSGQTNVPAGLSNVVAIAAGSVHSLVLKNDGKIVGWGTVGSLPTYKDVVAIAAGLGQSLALQADGTIRAWNTPNSTSGTPPAGLSNVVAIAAGVGAYGNTYQGVALKQDGTVAVWSSGPNNFGYANVPPEITSAVDISAGGSGTLALLNDRSPHVTAQPFDRHAVSGSNVTFAALSVGQPSLNFQWRLNGSDIPGATNPTLTLTNVSRSSRGNYSALVWNALGSTNSREAWLDVVGPVRLLSPSAGSSGAVVSFVAADSEGGALEGADAGWLEVQASTNLVNWQTIANTLVFTNGNLILQDGMQTNYPLRFYRLIER